VSGLELFFWPVRVLHDRPELALAPAVLFVLLAWRARPLPRHAPARLWPWVTAGMWGAYALYELRMRAWERAVTAPIRLDLLLIGPILYAATIATSVAWVRWQVRARRESRAPPGVGDGAARPGPPGVRPRP